MGILGWLAAGLYLAVGTGVLLADARPRAQQRAVEKFALNVGLPLPERLAEPIRNRMLNHSRLSTAGGMIGAVISVIVFLLSPASKPEGVLNVLIVVSGIIAGWAIGTSVSAICSSASRVSPGQVRYARAQAVELGDYISRGELWLARTPVALSVVAVAVVAALAQGELVEYNSTTALIGSITLSVVAVGTLVVCELVGRRLVAIGNQVESPEDLVWEDATRAMMIRQLAAAPTFLGYYSLLMAANPLLVSPAEGIRMGFAVAALGLALITVVIAVGMLVSVLAVKRHFLRRLWPELASEVAA